MTSERIEKAPLGLGFEMPETVWILEFVADRDCAVYVSPGSNFLAAWKDPVDLWRCVQSTPRFLAVAGVTEPTPKTPDGLISEMVDAEGFALLDADGEEIARRYAR